MTFLLDVNVLIALVDTDHVHHTVAHDWFSREGRQDWASCPITENGLVRIVGNPKYRNSDRSPGAIVDILARMTKLDGHVRWADDVSLTDSSLFIVERLRTPAQVTDAYLLGLAVRHGGKLATLDRRLSALPVIGGDQALHVI
ncbi:MAG: PIN domain-containing protein [Caulobacter sp.]|nr:PIN domain-containing protein [Caulobacter sp.]